MARRRYQDRRSGRPLTPAASRRAAAFPAHRRPPPPAARRSARRAAAPESDATLVVLLVALLVALSEGVSRSRRHLQPLRQGRFRGAGGGCGAMLSIRCREWLPIAIESMLGQGRLQQFTPGGDSTQPEGGQASRY